MPGTTVSEKRRAVSSLLGVAAGVTVLPWTGISPLALRYVRPEPETSH
jgi:hypothetical protein